MERVYEFKLTRRELAEIMAAASKVWEKGVEPEALAVVSGIQDKAAALLAYMDANERERQAKNDAFKAKKARQKAYEEYKRVMGDADGAGDGIVRDADGIPVLPFEAQSQK